MDKFKLAGDFGMSLLIIEDDVNKIMQIKDFIKKNYRDLKINEAYSFQSGLEKVLDLKPKIILLDMSLPTYDISINERGGRPRSFGGRDILSQIKRKKINSKAIIVTQFEDFQDEKESKSLDELKTQLACDFKENYSGTVCYQPSKIEWQSELKALIDSCLSCHRGKNA